jgi:hypothetical protein
MSDDIKKSRGRPKWQPDLAMIERLYSNMSTDQDVADICDVARKTVERHLKNDPEFRRAKTQGMAKARVSLRSEQFKLAKNGNLGMLVWLGKQYLGQKEKQEVDNISSDGSMTPKRIERVLIETREQAEEWTD